MSATSSPVRLGWVVGRLDRRGCAMVGGGVLGHTPVRVRCAAVPKPPRSSKNHPCVECRACALLHRGRLVPGEGRVARVRGATLLIDSGTGTELDVAAAIARLTSDAERAADGLAATLGDVREASGMNATYRLRTVRIRILARPYARAAVPRW